MDDSEALPAITIPTVLLLLFCTEGIMRFLGWMDPLMTNLPNQYWFVPEWSLYTYRIPALVLGVLCGVGQFVMLGVLVWMFIQLVISNNGNYFKAAVKYALCAIAIGILFMIMRSWFGGKK